MISKDICRSFYKKYSALDYIHRKQTHTHTHTYTYTHNTLIQSQTTHATHTYTHTLQRLIIFIVNTNTFTHTSAHTHTLQHTSAHFSTYTQHTHTHSYFIVKTRVKNNNKIKYNKLELVGAKSGELVGANTSTEIECCAVMSVGLEFCSGMILCACNSLNLSYGE